MLASVKHKPAALVAKPRQRLPPGSRPSEAFQNYRILALQRSFQGHRIYSGMTYHQFPLTADLPADIIHIPSSINRRAVNLYWDLLQAVLGQHGHEVFLEQIAHDPAAGWYIHYQSRDVATIDLLHRVATGSRGPSDPKELDLLIG
jgi:hypothetical protein